MTNSNISITGEFLPLSSLPDIKIEQRKGETFFKVTVTIDTAFSSTIIADCTIGASIAIVISGVTYTGIVEGFGCRPGHSILQIMNAVCTH